MKFWYLIHSKPKEEKVAQENLERQGYETYLPLILGRTKKRGKTIKTIQPMFPRYLFIHLSDQTDDWGPIRSTLGVSSLIRFGMTPAKVPDSLINSLKNNENSQGIHELPSKPLSPGDKLLIVEGLFEGYEATLFSKKSDDRVIVLLKIAENFVKVKLEQSLIEPIK
ncbi:MAG: transcription/translation regulatory transformer protein RfaH [Proteobacteria bacterium]|nr:transcription/translation regulatory transformer protein RfaH [Pseudomonadota bacterium]NOG59054.1 transcription/translation regulatory transformer protein RfaH [Pseudomonadota bacterium]